jgi:hypothetical protein
MSYCRVSHRESYRCTRLQNTDSDCAVAESARCGHSTELLRARRARPRPAPTSALSGKAARRWAPATSKPGRGRAVCGVGDRRTSRTWKMDGVAVPKRQRTRILRRLCRTGTTQSSWVDGTTRRDFERRSGEWRRPARRLSHGCSGTGCRR